MKFRKGTFEKIKKQKRERHAQRVELAPKIIEAGRYLSSSAFRIFCILKWFNPSFPSFKQIQVYTGLGSECVSNCLDELILKCMITCISGFAHRENNQYTIRPTAEWDILQIPLTPSEKRQAKKERKLALGRILAAVSALKLIRHNFDNRSSTTSIIEVVTTSTIEEELDQTITRSNNHLSDASRQCVGLSAEDIRKLEIIALCARLDKLKAEDQQRRIREVSRGENLQESRPV